MSEFPRFEDLSRREQRRVRGVRTVLAALVAHHTTTPFPAMSDHYRGPEQPPQPEQLTFPEPDEAA